jgi:hypothetical protein
MVFLLFGGYCGSYANTSTYVKVKDFFLAIEKFPGGMESG